MINHFLPKPGLTRAERRAVDAYSGPVTVCPPGAHTGVEFIHQPGKGLVVKKGNKNASWGFGRRSSKADQDEATIAIVREHKAAGKTCSATAKLMRIDYRRCKKMWETA